MGKPFTQIGWRLSTPDFLSTSCEPTIFGRAFCIPTTFRDFAKNVTKPSPAPFHSKTHNVLWEKTASIVGSSEALRRVLEQVSRVAPTDSTVLIQGEIGTGKELIARAIHNRSKRVNRAFIRVNCTAIPPSLIASELFGL